MSKTGYIQNKIHHNSTPKPKASSLAPFCSLSSQAPAAHPVAPQSPPTRDQALVHRGTPAMPRPGLHLATPPPPFHHRTGPSGIESNNRPSIQTQSLNSEAV